MRRLVLLALTLAVAPHAQTRLELADPLLLLDGQRLAVEGTPLTVPDFNVLELEIPTVGLIQVSDVPFDGARRAGDFDQTRLVLVVNGQSVRLRSRVPLLDASGPVPAYARLDPDPMTPTQGPAHVRHLPQTRLEAPSETPRPPSIETSEDLMRQLEALRVERDRLRDALAIAEQERDAARQRLAELRDEVERLRQEMSGERPSETQLRAERDALRDEVLRLRASLEALGSPPARPNVDSPAGTARVSLPDFDLSRLANRSEVLARLSAAQYPEWAEASRLGGDVLVLFQTDASGHVVRTAVPRPVGGGLDALAEEIVRGMRFIPVRADGQTTGLRSQVVVRFRP